MTEPDPIHNIPPSPPPQARGLGWLRFLVWILPSAILPMCIWGAYSFRILPFPDFLAGAATLGLTIYLGHFHALLRCQALGIPKEHPQAAIPCNVYRFVLLQILVIPGIWLTVAWGFCAIGSAFR